MNLLNPLGLAWAAVAVPIVALYVLKIRRRRQIVPTVMFWDQIFRDTAPRSLWRRLRHWLSLLMQLALLLLLVLALADPVSSWARRRPTHWVIVLDQSASMQATEAAPTRFDQARVIGHRIIRAMRAQDQATVIGAGPEVTIACGRTYHQPTLHDAVDALAVTGAPGDLHGALALAAAVDVTGQQRQVVVITDGGGAAQIDDDSGSAVTVYRCGGGGAEPGARRPPPVCYLLAGPIGQHRPGGCPSGRSIRRRGWWMRRSWRRGARDGVRRQLVATTVAGCGIRAAKSTRPRPHGPGRRDGRATRGDALRVAQAARGAGVRICTVPLRSGSRARRPSSST